MSRVVHFEIHASDAAGSQRFYCELFGWKICQWGENPYWLIETGPKEAMGINGGMLPRHGAPPVEGQAVNAFVCTVGVEDLDQTVAKALALGGTVALPRMEIPGVGSLAYLKDPDGNIFGVLQPAAGAMAP